MLKPGWNQYRQLNRVESKVMAAVIFSTVTNAARKRTSNMLPVQLQASNMLQRHSTASDWYTFFGCDIHFGSGQNPLRAPFKVVIRLLWNWYHTLFCSCSRWLLLAFVERPILLVLRCFRCCYQCCACAGVSAGVSAAVSLLPNPQSPGSPVSGGIY